MQLSIRRVLPLSAGLVSSVLAAQSPPPIQLIETRASATLHVRGYADFLVLHNEKAWVTNQGRVELLAPNDSVPVATVPIAEPCGAMAIEFGALWVVNCRAKTLARVDLATNRVVTEIATGVADPTGELSVATGAGSVWLLSDSSGVLSRIDPATNSLVATIQTGVPGGGGDIATGAGRVWVRAKTVMLQVIDPKRNVVIERYGPVAGSGAVRANERNVWVTAHDIHTVWVLPPRK
jgi:virginiamycin B lyase